MLLFVFYALQSFQYLFKIHCSDWWRDPGCFFFLQIFSSDMLFFVSLPSYSCFNFSFTSRVSSLFLRLIFKFWSIMYNIFPKLFSVIVGWLGLGVFYSTLLVLNSISLDTATAFELINAFDNTFFRRKVYFSRMLFSEVPLVCGCVFYSCILYFKVGISTNLHP